MQSKTERWSLVASRDQSRAEECLQALILSGTSARSVRVWTSFLELTRNWISSNLSNPSLMLEPSRIGTFEPNRSDTVTPRELCLTMENWTEELIGYDNLVLDWETHT